MEKSTPILLKSIMGTGKDQSSCGPPLPHTAFFVVGVEHPVSVPQVYVVFELCTVDALTPSIRMPPLDNIFPLTVMPVPNQTLALCRNANLDNAGIPKRVLIVRVISGWDKLHPVDVMVVMDDPDAGGSIVRENEPLP